MANSDEQQDGNSGISLGNILISGEDVLLHYEFTKLVLAFAQKNEVMSHKLIGIMEATKHGLCTYTDMICVKQTTKNDCLSWR